MLLGQQLVKPADLQDPDISMHTCEYNIIIKVNILSPSSVELADVMFIIPGNRDVQSVA